MKIVVSGASGLIGTPLVKQLSSHGHEVIRLVRRTARSGESQWDPKSGVIDASVIDGADAVIHLAGAGIGDKRWTAAYKREVLESRTLSTALLARTIASASNKPKVFLSGSAIGFYGARGDEQLTESGSAGSGFLADVCKEWEASAAPAREVGVRTVFLRTGIVLSPRGGALKKLLPLFRLGVGGRFGNGKQWQSWISLTDELNAIEHLLTANIDGPVNLTAPLPVTNGEFTKVLARVLKRPALVPVPGFGPRLLLGGELADALLFTGQRVLPEKLQASGYQFAHRDLESALRSLLNR
jgi:uncharacterized protein (TIGR01777 family)